MFGIWGQPKNVTFMKVCCSKYGQPIGETRSKFQEFLESLARNRQYKFDLPSSSRGIVLQSIDSKWRSWKSKLKRKYYDPEKSIQIQSACPTKWVVQKNEMNEKTTLLSPNSEDIIASNDILSQVIGPDKYYSIFFILIICFFPRLFVSRVRRYTNNRD
ncbi:hypothetical protein M9H77_02271 [Catharanthus roseus]|uniref:Uncharacterized protein n=1 Tax=Catharanthus roseus TaxID=4058 RepID=A0ACC0C8B9_CATRO|nr:hypothetical protein M9H77_02271 [Catharanthus roseus]